MKMKKVEIGDRFIKRGDKQKRINTVIDIMTVTNSKGEVVKQYAVSECDFSLFVLGQTIRDYEVPFATVQRGLIK